VQMSRIRPSSCLVWEVEVSPGRARRAVLGLATMFALMFALIALRRCLPQALECCPTLIQFRVQWPVTFGGAVGGELWEVETIVVSWHVVE
jgi:hypothetical protein